MLANDIVVLDELSLSEIKTKEIVKVLDNLNIEGSALVVLPAVDEKVVKSARNIPGLKPL